MGTGGDLHEIVQVISHCRLLDSNQQEQMYWRRDGLGLPKGWYIVNWPKNSIRDRFNEAARFRGPYRSQEDALATTAVPSSAREEGISRNGLQT